MLALYISAKPRIYIKFTHIILIKSKYFFRQLLAIKGSSWAYVLSDCCACWSNIRRACEKDALPHMCWNGDLVLLMFGRKKKRNMMPYEVEQSCLKWTKPCTHEVGWIETRFFALVPHICWVNLVRTVRSGRQTAETLARGGGTGTVFWVIRRIWINLMCWQMEKEQMCTHETCRCNKCWLD